MVGTFFLSWFLAKNINPIIGLLPWIVFFYIVRKIGKKFEKEDSNIENKSENKITDNNNKNISSSNSKINSDKTSNKNMISQTVGCLLGILHFAGIILATWTMVATENWASPFIVLFLYYIIWIPIAIKAGMFD